MKQFLTLSAILAMALPAMAAGVSDNFDGGFQLGGAPGGWNWLADGSYTATTVGTGEDDLSLTAPWPPAVNGGSGASYVVGAVGATASYTDTVVSVLVNTNSPNPYNDQGILCMLNTGTFQFYGLNYDPFYGHVEIIYGAGGETWDMGDIRGIEGGDDQIFNIKLSAVASDSGTDMYLVSQVWSEDGLNMLGEFQAIANGTNIYDGIPIPVLPGGMAGVLGAVNGNNPGPLDTMMDDWAARPGLNADYDLDGDVDVADLGVLATNYGATGGMMWSQGDANLDGDVNVTDLGILATHYGSVAAAAGAAVPEPSMLCLLGLGSLAMLLSRRR